MAIMGSRPIDELMLNKDIITGMANISDAAIITIGRNSGEGADQKKRRKEIFSLTIPRSNLLKMLRLHLRQKIKRRL